MRVRKPFVVTFGRMDGTATKHIFPDTREQALALLNALSYVFFLKHEFKSSQCQSFKRVENDEWFIEFDPVRSIPS